MFISFQNDDPIFRSISGFSPLLFCPVFCIGNGPFFSIAPDFKNVSKSDKSKTSHDRKAHGLSARCVSYNSYPQYFGKYSRPKRRIESIQRFSLLVVEGG